MDKNSNSGFKYITTSMADIVSSPNSTAKVILENTLKDDSGKPIKIFKTNEPKVKPQ